MDQVEFRTRYAGNTYNAGPVRGLRASCTMGSRAAAEALARKLWPGLEFTLTRLGTEDDDDAHHLVDERWRAVIVRW